MSVSDQTTASLMKEEIDFITSLLPAGYKITEGGGYIRCTYKLGDEVFFTKTGSYFVNTVVVPLQKKFGEKFLGVYHFTLNAHKDFALFFGVDEKYYRKYNERIRYRALFPRVDEFGFDDGIIWDVQVFKRPYFFGKVGKMKWVSVIKTNDLSVGLGFAAHLVDKKQAK